MFLIDLFLYAGVYCVSKGSVIVCSLTLISDIYSLLCLDVVRTIHELISTVFLGFDLLESRLSVKYFRLVFLIWLFVWFQARLY